MGTLKGFIFDRDGIVNKLINETGKLRPLGKYLSLLSTMKLFFFQNI